MDVGRRRATPPPSERKGGPGRTGVEKQTKPALRKQQSHARIVEEAARLIRERGIDGASVDDVMAAAGLTRGGFYAHFDDKVQLVSEAIEHMFEGALTNLFGVDMPNEAKAWRERAAKRYLSESHVDDPGHGCGAAAIGGEIARAEPAIRDTTRKQVARVIDQIQERIGGDPATARQRAIAFLATCVGGITLARAVGDRSTVKEILGACRRDLQDR